MRDKIARTNVDFEAGILNGKTVFPFGEAGSKPMTMTTKYGNVPYPVKYTGTTNGVVTDRGVAQPGQDFQVNGDTVVEEPDFDSMSFSMALKHSKNNKLLQGVLTKGDLGPQKQKAVNSHHTSNKKL